jgi:hypothetical protein
MYACLFGFFKKQYLCFSNMWFSGWEYARSTSTLGTLGLLAFKIGPIYPSKKKIYLPTLCFFYTPKLLFFPFNKHFVTCFPIFFSLKKISECVFQIFFKFKLKNFRKRVIKFYSRKKTKIQKRRKEIGGFTSYRVPFC